MLPAASTPCPTILQPQCAQEGAIAWDRAFEAVEGHRAAGARHLECLVVIIAADIACRHRGSPEMPYAANGGGGAGFRAGSGQSNAVTQPKQLSERKGREGHAKDAMAAQPFLSLL